LTYREGGDELITYKVDKILEHRQYLLDRFLQYNESVTGVTDYGPFCVYLLKDEKLVGGIQSSYDSNWADLGEVYYESKLILRIMLNELYKKYKGQVQGISFDSHVPVTIEDLIDQGFNAKVVLEGKPLGKTSYELVNEEMAVVAFDHDYTLVTSAEPHDLYKEIMEQHLKEYNQAHDLKDDAERLQVVAFDGQDLIGGVHGYLEEDYLLVSLLWVEERYRKLNIATELMGMIEREASSRNITSSYLGTTNFQAKGFYEKLGYVVAGTYKEMPKGYENYTMIKLVI